MPTSFCIVAAYRIVNWIGVFVCAVAMFGLGTIASLAAEETSSAAMPGVEVCEGARAPIDEILDLLSEQATPDGFGGKPIWDSLPPGTPPDAITEAEIERTFWQIEACINSGNVVNLLGYFSSDGLLREFGGMSAESVAELRDLVSTPATPVPAGSRIVFAGPWHVQVLADGRVLAAVVWFGSEADTCIDPLRIDVLVFEQQDGQWLIDEWIERFGMLDPVDVVGLPPEVVMPSALARCPSAPPPVRGPNN